MAILRKSALSTLPALPQLSEALERAEQRLADWLLDPQRVQALLAQVFPSPPTPAWHGLRETLLAGRLQLDLQIREDWEMPGLAGAFQAPAPSRPQGLILLNRRWLASATAAAVEAVLLEELGHAIDRQLHGAVDSAGDEGERFSTLLRGQQPSLTSQREDDSRELLISGQRIRVEGSGNAAVALPSVSLALTTPAGATAPQRTAFGGSTIRLDANLSLGSLTGSPTRMLVHFARGYVAGEDELVVVGSLPAAIRASFDKTRGILNLVAVSGQTPSQTDWRDALRAVAYRNLNSSATPARVPTAGDRELVITTGELPALFINNQAHFYRFESAPAPGAGSNAWLRARDAAAASTYGSLSGYLATITSADENAFITRALLPVEGRTWLGGSDAGTEGKWSWDAGSASPESSTATFSQTVSGSLTSKAVGSLYVNWEANQGTGKDEDHLSIASTGRWSDDDGANFSTKDYGYLVEYSPATGTPDSTRRLVVRPLPAVADQTFTVADYGSQAIQGTTYTLTNANLDLLLFGGEKLTIQASSVTISNGKIVSLKGSGTATSLYGLSDVNLSAITINASSRSITGKAKIGDQEINLSGSLKLESNGRYSFADLTGSISNEALTKLLPEGGYLSQATGGGYSFRKDTAGTSLELAIKGVASFDPRPDLADVSTPFTVRIANGVFSNGKLSAMDLQRQGTTPWKLMLADHELTVNSETITYKRDQQAPSLNSNTPTLVKHLYSLDLAGDLKQTEGDILKLDGVLTLASAVSGSGAPLQQPMAASFDILNNQIFRVGDTRLKANGGLKLNYQEDASRRFGMLALAGDAKIDLEIFKDLDIKLGEDNQNLPALLNSQADKLMATEWTLGRMSSVPVASRRDLGLLSYKNVHILPMHTEPLINEGSVEQPAVSTQQQQDLLDALEPTLGLYRVANLDAKIIT
ncbi:MAG: hypothetical protein RLZZ611_997, partial [Cyanobacteriota bacterium]